MATLFAPVEDGKIMETASQTSLKKANSSSNNGMDKDAFLQLLVAQMQYQDPLEPTSNTEYISQYAQFSQVEQIQNMAASTNLARASALVGETVYVKTTTSSGESKYVEGKVDYVVFENNKAYLSIDESLYSMDDLDTIVDLEYKKAFDKAYDFTLSLNKLPKPTGIDLSYKDKIEKMIEIYEGMNDYEKSFLAKDTVERYEKYVERWNEVKLADTGYKTALDKAENFTQSLDKLPAVSAIDLSCKDQIEELIEIYEGMNDYEKSFLKEEIVEKYEKYVEKWEMVKLVAETDKLLQMASETADKLQQGTGTKESGNTSGSEATGAATETETAGAGTSGSAATGTEAAGAGTSGGETA